MDGEERSGSDLKAEHAVYTLPPVSPEGIFISFPCEPADTIKRRWRGRGRCVPAAAKDTDDVAGGDMQVSEKIRVAAAVTIAGLDGRDRE